MKRVFRPAYVAFLVGLAMALLVSTAPPAAVASGFVPDPPDGWRIGELTEPAWSFHSSIGDGVAAVSTAPADSRAFQAHFDFYLLDRDDAAGSAATVLRDYLQGLVFGLDGGLVLYGKQRPGTDLEEQILDLYVRDLGSGAVTKLPMGSGLELNPNGVPRIDRGHVVWSQFGFQHEPEIMMYDVAARSVRRLSQGDEAQGAPDIDGEDVVWQAWNGARHRILHCDLASGVVRELAAGISWTAGLSPQVDDGRAIWITHERVGALEERESLHLADLATGATRVVVTSPGHLEATLEGDLLVMATRIGDEPIRLVVRNLQTDTDAKLGDWFRPPLSFSIDDGMVAWEDVTPLPSGEGYDNRLLIFDSTTGKTTELASGRGLWRPVIDGRRVVFAESLDSVTGRLWVAEPEVASASDYYLDVPRDAPYRDAILDFTSGGFVSGYSAGAFRTFHADYPLLRAQLTKILVNALSLAVDEDMTCSFADLGSDSAADLYPHEYVAAAVKAGLLKGYSTKEFGPWDQLTRAQMVTILVRAVQGLTTRTLIVPPEDYVGSVTGAPAVHAPNLLLAEYNGLLDDLIGYGPNWDPNSFARRGEVIELLYGFLATQGR